MEKLPAIILMRVVNRLAPHYKQVGKIVDISEDGERIVLEFEGGGRHWYDKNDLELVLP